MTAPGGVNHWVIRWLYERLRARSGGSVTAPGGVNHWVVRWLHERLWLGERPRGGLQGVEHANEGVVPDLDDPVRAPAGRHQRPLRRRIRG